MKIIFTKPLVVLSTIFVALVLILTPFLIKQEVRIPGIAQEDDLAIRGSSGNWDRRDYKLSYTIPGQVCVNVHGHVQNIQLTPNYADPNGFINSITLDPNGWDSIDWPNCEFFRVNLTMNENTWQPGSGKAVTVEISAGGDLFRGTYTETVRGSKTLRIDISAAAATLTPSPTATPEPDGGFTPTPTTVAGVNADLSAGGINFVYTPPLRSGITVNVKVRIENLGPDDVPAGLPNYVVEHWRKDYNQTDFSKISQVAKSVVQGIQARRNSGLIDGGTIANLAAGATYRVVLRVETSGVSDPNLNNNIYQYEIGVPIDCTAPPTKPDYVISNCSGCAWKQVENTDSYIVRLMKEQAGEDQIVKEWNWTDTIHTDIVWRDEIKEDGRYYCSVSSKNQCGLSEAVLTAAWDCSASPTTTPTVTPTIPPGYPTCGEPTISPPPPQRAVHVVTHTFNVTDDVGLAECSIVVEKADGSYRIRDFAPLTGMQAECSLDWAPPYPPDGIYHYQTKVKDTDGNETIGPPGCHEGNYCIGASCAGLPVSPAGADVNGDGVEGDILDWTFALEHYGETQETPQGFVLINAATLSDILTILRAP